MIQVFDSKGRINKLPVVRPKEQPKQYIPMNAQEVQLLGNKINTAMFFYFISLVEVSAVRAIYDKPFSKKENTYPDVVDFKNNIDIAFRMFYEWKEFIFGIVEGEYKDERYEILQLGYDTAQVVIDSMRAAIFNEIQKIVNGRKKTDKAICITQVIVARRVMLMALKCSQIITQQYKGRKV